MFRCLCRISILLVVLTACAPVAATMTPIASTATPSRSPLIVLPESTPTSESMPTVSETNSPLPTETNTPTEAIPTATLFPFPTFSLSPTPATDVPQPDAEAGTIQIYAPGPLSKIVSPVAFYGYAIPGFDHKGTMYLYGEDGRLLASESLQLNTAYQWAYFTWSLPFTINSTGELGRLSLSTSDQYGRMTALYSVHLLLLSQGSSLVNPAGDLRERCVIEQPAAGKRISGGTLTIAGEMRPFSSQPLQVELVKRDGSVIASQTVPISPAQDDQYVPFSLDLPYSISTGTWALLTVSQPDERIPGTMYLYSREFFLNP